MKRKTHAGFTIIELMLTIAIAAVLLAVAVPSYRTMVLNNCLTSKTNSFVSAMQLARSSAVTFREDVTVGALTCRLDTNDDDAAEGNCATAPFPGNEFGAGVVVYRDLDADGFADTASVEDPNGNGTLEAGEDLNNNGIIDLEIIRRISFTCDATMNETTDGGNDTTNNSTAFVYGPNGSANPRATLDVCDSRPSSEYSGRRITLSATGRPTTDPTFTCP